MTATSAMARAAENSVAGVAGPAGAGVFAKA